MNSRDCASNGCKLCAAIVDLLAEMPSHESVPAERDTVPAPPPDNDPPALVELRGEYGKLFAEHEAAKRRIAELESKQEKGPKSLWGDTLDPENLLRGEVNALRERVEALAAENRMLDEALEDRSEGLAESQKHNSKVYAELEASRRRIAELERERALLTRWANTDVETLSKRVAALESETSLLGSALDRAWDQLEWYEAEGSRWLAYARREIAFLSTENREFLAAARHWSGEAIRFMRREDEANRWLEYGQERCVRLIDVARRDFDSANHWWITANRLEEFAHDWLEYGQQRCIDLAHQLEQSHENARYLQERWEESCKQRKELAASNALLRDEKERLHQRLKERPVIRVMHVVMVGDADTVNEAWQNASGMVCGGDPSGVKPDHLGRFVRELNDVVDLAEAHVTGPFDDHKHTALVNAIREFRKRYPTE